MAVSGDVGSSSRIGPRHAGKALYRDRVIAAPGEGVAGNAAGQGWLGVPMCVPWSEIGPARQLFTTGARTPALLSRNEAVESGILSKYRPRWHL
jgi:hypothetical protein